MIRELMPQLLVETSQTSKCIGQAQINFPRSCLVPRDVHFHFCIPRFATLGERLAAKVPHGHWKPTTLIAALGNRGMRCSTTVDGAVNREVFESFLEQVLIESLSPGDLVVMDNLSSHKGVLVRQLIESVGATVLYLPPYSPDLNLIELAFSKLKQLMRSSGHRTMEAACNPSKRIGVPPGGNPDSFRTRISQ
jgi:transposase